MIIGWAICLARLTKPLRPSSLRNGGAEMALPDAGHCRVDGENKFSRSWERRTPVRPSPEGAEHTGARGASSLILGLLLLLGVIGCDDGGGGG
jgi:hypothetical protein